MNWMGILTIICSIAAGIAILEFSYKHGKHAFSRKKSHSSAIDDAFRTDIFGSRDSFSGLFNGTRGGKRRKK
jgi:hypothetical protein